MNKIAVIGAGLIGRLIGLALLRQGQQVSLFDRGDQSAVDSAAWAAGGLLTPLGEAPSCPAAIVNMGLVSLAKWPAIIDALDQPVFFQRAGTLVVAHQADQGDMQQFRGFIEQHWSSQGALDVSGVQLAELAPGLSSRFKHGFYLPNEGQLDNRQLLQALGFQLQQAGVIWHEQQSIDRVGNGYIVAADQQRRAFDCVIDCRGLGARPDLPSLRGVRGEITRLYAPQVKWTRPLRLMHPRYQLYIAPKGGGVFVIGATQIESDDQRPITVRSTLELLSAAYSVEPQFAEAQVIEQRSGCRPAFIDNLPTIDYDSQLIRVNGLYRHGFLISPVLLQWVLQLYQRLASGGLSDSGKLSMVIDSAEFGFDPLRRDSPVK